jgi:AraC family transcriptional regulator
MNVSIEQLFPIRVVMMSHRGAYSQLSSKFDQLWSICEKEAVPIERAIGIYWDNPEFVPENQLRSGACFEVRGGYALTKDIPGVMVTEIAGGKYAKVIHKGSYEDLEQVYQQMINEIENKMGLVIGEQPGFEIYVNDPSETAEKDLITECYLPVS